MKTFAVLSAAALIGVGALTSTAAEARGGGELAAGLIGGLAAGALIGAAISDAHPGPGYGYADDRAYGYRPAPPVSYRAVRVVPDDVYDAGPVYARRGWDGYRAGPRGYDDGYGPVAYRWHPHCDRPYGDRGW